MKEKGEEDLLKILGARGTKQILEFLNLHGLCQYRPSEQDILLTQQLCLCGKVLGIEVIDHVIIGISGYASFKKRI